MGVFFFFRTRQNDGGLLARYVFYKPTNGPKDDYYFIRFIYLLISLCTYLLTERATGLGRRTNEEFNIEKWDQTESPEIPDRGETSEIPGLPSGGNLELLLLLFIVGLYYSPVNRSGSP